MLQLKQSPKDASDFLDKIVKATAALQCERQKHAIAGARVTGGLVEIHELENLVVISDLHGDSNSLFKILAEINYEKFLVNQCDIM